MIPSAVNIGAAWNVLPPGIHDASFNEAEDSFATNERREELFDGFFLGCQGLKSAGCTVVLLNGSFVTDKPDPGDYDACWDPTSVDLGKLDPVLLDFSNARS